MAAETKSKRACKISGEEWNERWDALAKKVDLAWKSDKSAIDIISEMRR